MSETQMPATEASLAPEQELMSYEFAFHVLPTVAEGEVAGIFESLKAQIIKAGGTITSEEAPERFDLAYDIIKYLEGKNRKFSSAYFGWVRFTLKASAVTALTEEIEGVKEILRYLLIKLTRVEEENSFNFHESIVDRKVRTITDEEVAPLEEVEAVEEVTEAVEEVAAEVPEETTAAAEETGGALVK